MNTPTAREPQPASRAPLSGHIAARVRPTSVQTRLRLPLSLVGATLCCYAPASGAAAPANDYPTAARVEYVQECMTRNGGTLAELYKCSCVIDRLAEQLTYEEFVEASTFAHYAGLPGEGGGIFRDTAHARERAKLYLRLEAEAYRGCGLAPAAAGGSHP